MVFSDSFATNLLTLAVSFVVVLIGYFKWSFYYWHRRNVPYLEPEIPYGNCTEALRGKENIAVTLNRIYNEMKTRGWKHGGIYIFTSPNYLPIDLDYLKNIISKDFQYFTDRVVYYNEKGDPLYGHLLNLCGAKWKNMRARLTPTFTSGKMKTMFQTLADCTVNLEKKLDMETSKKRPVNIKEILGCFTTDIIGSCAFGLDCKTFEEDDAPFRVYGKMAFQNTKWQRLLKTICYNFPGLASRLNISITPKAMTNFFMEIVKNTVDYREKNNLSRNDFMQLLIDMKNNKSESDSLTLTTEAVAAQCFVFFIAGFETSSTLMTFALYELGRHLDIQENLRNEINFVLRNHNGKITYEAIQEMKYMNQVIDETLRMHPPAPIISRRCTKDYKVPNEDVVIEKGTNVLIPIMAIHHDKDHYPEPEKFDPGRFTEENKNSRHSCAHIPFGDGPRACIGIRFGLMQAKVGLTCLIRKYKFTVNEKTREPLELAPNTFLNFVKGDVWLDVTKI